MTLVNNEVDVRKKIVSVKGLPIELDEGKETHIGYSLFEFLYYYKK